MWYTQKTTDNASIDLALVIAVLVGMVSSILDLTYSKTVSFSTLKILKLQLYKLWMAPFFSDSPIVNY